MTSKYANRQFWIDTADRAVATFAQAAVATLTANVTGILDVDFAQLASVAGLAAGVSVLTSIAFRGTDKTPPTGPSANGSVTIITPGTRDLHAEAWERAHDDGEVR